MSRNPLAAPRMLFRLWIDGEDADDFQRVFASSAEAAVEAWVEDDGELLASVLAQPLTVLARDSAGLVTRVRVRAEQHVSVHAMAVDRPRPDERTP